MTHEEIQRELLQKIRAYGKFECKRNILAIMGYPIAQDERELTLIVQTLKRAVYPPRSRGIH